MFKKQEIKLFWPKHENIIITYHLSMYSTIWRYRNVPQGIEAARQQDSCEANFDELRKTIAT